METLLAAARSTRSFVGEVDFVIADEALLIAELAGFLRAFAWVNNKCNNGFDFRVECIDGDSDVEFAVAKHFASENALSISITETGCLRENLSMIFIRWLLCYLNDAPAHDRLHDVAENFSLSHPEFHSQLLDPIFDIIETLVPAGRMYRIDLTTVGFYACDSDDLVIAQDHRMLFLHFSVSD